MSYFVYKITNKINGKIYIGKAKNIRKRFTHHIWCATQEAHPEYRFHLQRAIRKYGKDNFVVEQIEELLTGELSFERETFWILHYQSNNRLVGYNKTMGGDGCSGRILSQESKDKISLLAITRYASGKQIPSMLNKQHSDESKDKMSQIAKEKGFGSFAKGSQHPNSILNEEIVKNIRNEYEIMTAPQLSKKYNVSLQTVKSIVQKRRWKHVI